MKTLSVRQPWLFAISNGKPVENRTWTTAHRGEIALHASGRARWDRDGEYSPLVRQAWRTAGNDGPLYRDSPGIVYGAVLLVVVLALALPERDRRGRRRG